MTEYFEGNTWIKPPKRDRVKSIMEIKFDSGLILYTFPGGISPNDVLIKFKDVNLTGKNIRQPKHIHWVVDILIKKENNPELTDKFLNAMLERWKNIKPLPDRSFNTLKEKMVSSINSEFIRRFDELNKHGFFSMDFITHLMELLMLQEKSNNPNAYMFREVIEETIEFKDLYAMISKATHNR